MKKITFVVSEYLQNNSIYDSSNKLNRDNIFNKYIALKKELKKYNYDLSTAVNDDEYMNYLINIGN